LSVKSAQTTNKGDQATHQAAAFLNVRLTCTVT